MFFDTVYSSTPTDEWLRLNRNSIAPEAAERMEALIDGALDLKGKHQSVEDRISDLEWRLDEISSKITQANWRTGKKAELKDLIEAVNDLTDYNDIT